MLGHGLWIFVVELPDVQQKSRQIWPLHRGHGENGKMIHFFPERGEIRHRRGEVSFIGHDGAGPVRQAWSVHVELVAEMLQLAPRLRLGQVNDVQQAHAALNVTEKVDAEAAVFVRVRHEPGDVGDGDLHVVFVLDEPHVRLECGEGVAGHFGPGSADGAEETGLSSVGEADLT